MPSTALGNVGIEAMRLQNGYAFAIDSRNWDYFRTLFTPDVVADYPNGVFDGMDAWLDLFVPLHDEYAWTLHEMTNHLVGEDAGGVWAMCYGFVEWTQHDAPGRMNRARVIYRDRLVDQDGAWLISRRTLKLLMSQPGAPIADGVNLPNSVIDFADVS